tara:strand:- start:559 stop:1155 length:597 start_codon:yes stop_codon:yes gene_type:complete
MTKDNVTRGYGLLERFLAKKRAKMANEIIPLALRTGRILDIGCGPFPYFLLNTEFKNKYGMDRVVNISHSTDNINIGKFDLESGSKLPFENDFFDVITMLAVFEHIKSEKILIAIPEIRRVLKPEGRFILTVPSPWTEELLRVMAVLRLVSRDEIREHKCVYSHRDIIDYLLRCEFERDKMKLGYFEMFLNIWAFVDK